MPPTPDEFAHFSLVGARFEAEGMPADSASEIAYYREAIFDVARRIWVDFHPGRSRAPRGFRDGFDLRLTRVLPGSARPQLILRRPADRSQEEWDEWLPVYTTARDLVTRAIRTVNSEHVIPNGFPRGSVQRLRRLGTSLREQETITVGPPRWEGPRATLDQSFRETLLAIDDVLDEAAERTVEGVVSEFNGAAGSFELKSTDDVVVTCILPESREALSRAVKGFLASDGVTAPDVQVTGSTTLDDDGLIRVMSNVSSVKLIRTVPQKVLVSKLDELRELPNGWRGDGSLRVGDSVLESAEAIVPMLGDRAAEIRFTPGEHGSLLLEWVREAVEYTAELQPDGMLFLCSDDTRTDELAETELPYAESALIRFIENGDW